MPTAAEPPKLPSRMVPRPEVCRMFGVIPQTLDNWVKAGRFPRPIKLGNRVFWPIEDLTVFLNQRRGA